MKSLVPAPQNTSAGQCSNGCEHKSDPVNNQHSIPSAFLQQYLFRWRVSFLIQQLLTLWDLKLISLQAVLKHLHSCETKNNVQPYILHLHGIIF